MVHIQLHGVLPVADSVHTDVSEVVSLLTNTRLVVDFVGCRRKREAVRSRGALLSRVIRAQSLRRSIWISQERTKTSVAAELFFFPVACLMVLLADTVSVGLGPLACSSSALSQCKFPDDNLAQVRWYCAQSCSDTP